MATQRPILIAGGGPVGVITALALARQGLPVQVFEAEAKVNDMPRAATTHAATLEMLAGLGMVDEVIERGLVEPLFRIWDGPSNQMIAEFDFDVLGVGDHGCEMAVRLNRISKTQRIRLSGELGGSPQLPKFGRADLEAVFPDED